MSDITFVSPVPGIDARRFELAAEEGFDGVFTLASVDSPGVRLLVVDPFRWVPDYTPTITPSDLDTIGVGDDEIPVLLLVANASAGQLTVNLLAPVLVNTHTGTAVQTILGDLDLPTRHPLVPVAA